MPNEIANLKTRIAEANAAELTTMLSEFRREHFQLRMQAATASIDNPKRIWFVRKAIARVQTALTERASAGEAQ